MSLTPNPTSAPTGANTTAPQPGPIALACPSCRSSDDLHAVEVVEVLVEARFFLADAEPRSGESSQLLADTQHRQSDGAIVCRNCDQVDLRYGDPVPAITLTDPNNHDQAPSPAQSPVKESGYGDLNSRVRPGTPSNNAKSGHGKSS